MSDDDRNPALFLPFALASDASGLTSGRLIRMAKRGSITTRMFGPVSYVYWPTVVAALPPLVVKILELSALVLPARRTHAELLQLLHGKGFVDITAARSAVGAGRSSFYRWIKTGKIAMFRLDRKIFLKWSELLKVLGAFAEITHLDPKKPPVPKIFGAARQPQGPRLMPGSLIAKRLRAEGFVSVREAAREIGLGEHVLRKLVTKGEDGIRSRRWGSSVLVNLESVQRLVQGK